MITGEIRINPKLVIAFRRFAMLSSIFLQIGEGIKTCNGCVKKEYERAKKDAYF
jgi:hypothetical protein